MSGARKRADQVLVDRGFAPSRAQAQAAIEAGLVSANGQAIQKAAEKIEENAEITYTAPHPWVSRGGVKLAHALDVFVVDPFGRYCLDVGASTGGFTDVLLAGDAKLVYAVDVGRDQLHPKLRADPRVVSLEGQDARLLTREMIAEPPTLIVVDASFIGLEKILPVPLSLGSLGVDLIALVKPQYEAGPGKQNFTYEEARHLAVETAGRIDGLGGLLVQKLVDSPISGGEGAREFLLHARRA